VDHDFKTLFRRSFKVGESTTVRGVGAGVGNSEDTVAPVIRRIDVVVLGPSIVQDFFGQFFSLYD
jgi:hypothetical protein